ncbi:chitobiase/beta-hexosaminidase C-terminal domain-containing protein [Chengkuizengella axinellae]|uniref:Chitobiase/beta-hexosaminidase C-terminal domain-containing protein n=1 Tax=Chengkuizengella axinellae TaxID=3064388 RepID=A0ABT9J2T1_9BACL|nr:chitobiase/beta-hexosaminidase C-terminal domain-containing protein [Chengkuizengella sp. 2205SS18-9]MDP5275921.1 chitobiase/beta-hexosaminidase C-terminal domain-containing protein [Chengkuizengella sp. 2205SS18-9]
MKKSLSIFIAFVLVISLLSSSFMNISSAEEQTFIETLSNADAPGNTYADGSFLGDNDIAWSYISARDESGYGIDGNGLMLRNAESNSSIVSEVITGGIHSFSVNLKKGFTGAGNRQVELFINGESKGTSEAFDDTDVHTFTVDEINVAGDVEIKIVNTTTKQVVIDNITWTSFDGQITQVSSVKALPAVGEVEAGTEVTLSTSTADAQIYYTVDDSEPTNESTLYENPILVEDSVTIKAVAYKDGLDPSEIATFDYTVKPPLALSNITDVRSNVGLEAKIQGIVTASFEAGGKTNLYVQDETAGIIVRGSGLSASIGDKVSAEGTVSEYFGMSQFEVNEVVVVTEGEGTPEPQVVTSSDLTSENGEAVEAELVTIKNITIQEVDNFGNYTAVDENGTFKLYPEDESLLEVGKTYEQISGVVNYNYNEYKIVPRFSVDVIEEFFTVYAQPGSGKIEKGNTVSLKTFVEEGTIYYTLDGTNPTTESNVYVDPIQINEDTTIKAIVVESSNVSDVATFDYTVVLPLDSLSIHDIQGVGHTSLYEGLVVKDVIGVVTHVNGTSGFYIESIEADDDIRTSEGIYVYVRNSAVKVGDLVSVTGGVVEYREDGYDDAADLLTTQISANSVQVIAMDHTIPAPVELGVDREIPTSVIDNDGFDVFDPEEDGIDFYESLEGMRVVINDASVIAPPKYDEIPVVLEGFVDANRTPNGGILITEDDLNPERIMVKVSNEPNVKVGDRFDGTITGIFSYDYSNFKLLAIDQLPQVVDGGAERAVTTIQPTEDKLTVASYNVENFSLESGQEKIDTIAESMITNLNTPDIIGLVEVQDNDGPTDSGVTDASESYKALIEAIEAHGGPTYEFTEIAPVDKTDGGQPGGNIRVGYIYNPERVSLVEKEAGDATTAVGYDEDGLTFNPGRIDPTNEAFESSRKSLAAEFEFNGERVIVIANHFNSKRGDGAPFGSDQPVVLGSEPQRLEMAAVINGFIQDVLSVNPEANIVVLGDMNDFEFSNPLDVLKGNELVNMIDELPAEERYTYNYQGNSQVLDHILVSENLVDFTVADIVNMNADFTEEHGRTSDHDPVMIQIDFQDPVGELTNDFEDLKNGDASTQVVAEQIVSQVISEEFTPSDISSLLKEVFLTGVSDHVGIKHVENTTDHIERDLERMLKDLNKANKKNFDQDKYVKLVEKELAKLLK